MIDGEGELQAAEKLAQAGQILAERPEAMQLRYIANSSTEMDGPAHEVAR